MPLPPNPNAFANYPLDRAAHRRRDGAWIAEALACPQARLIPFHERQPLVLAGAPAKDGSAGAMMEAAWLGGHARSLLAGKDSPTIFLGVDEAGAPYFAVEAKRGFDLNDSPLAGLGEFMEMRAAAAVLPAGEVAVLGAAKALFEWHARHRFCSNCGEPSAIEEAGWKRVCASCEGEHFPRTDPVVIMLAGRGDKCLLGRQKRFPRGMYSALAGFVEPGESIEEACARELFEEAGVRAVSVRYHSAQPWPFPSSLMIGLIAEVENEDLTIDKDELEEARWFTREETRALLEGKGAGLFVPPPLAIAHQIIKAWAFER